MLTLSPSQRVYASPSSSCHCQQFKNRLLQTEVQPNLQSPQQPTTLWRTRAGSVVASPSRSMSGPKMPSDPHRCVTDASAQNSPVALPIKILQGTSVAISGTSVGGGLCGDIGLSSIASTNLRISNTAAEEPTLSTSQAHSPSTSRRPSQHGTTPTAFSADDQHSPSKPPIVAVKILPTKYESCNVEDLVVLIANMISELIQINDQLPLRGDGLTRFHSRFVL